MMKATELVAKLKDIAKNYKTLYVMGCFGAPMTTSLTAVCSKTTDTTSVQQIPLFNNALLMSYSRSAIIHTRRRCCG